MPEVNKWHPESLGATQGLDWTSGQFSIWKYIQIKNPAHNTRDPATPDSGSGYSKKDIATGQVLKKCTKFEPEEAPTTACLRLLILFPLVLNTTAITFHKELKKALLQELHDSMGWSYSRGNGNVNKQSEAISWSRARKGRELVGAVQVSGYIPWGRTLAAMHRRAGSYLEELQKWESLYSCHGWKGKRANSGCVDCLAWESTVCQSIQTNCTSTTRRHQKQIQCVLGLHSNPNQEYTGVVNPAQRSKRPMI